MKILKQTNKQQNKLEVGAWLQVNCVNTPNKIKTFAFVFLFENEEE